MASSSSGGGQAKPRNLVLGLTILVLVIAAVIGISFLSNPYCAIAERGCSRACRGKAICDC